MNSKAALTYLLLTGKTINIGNIHKYTGYTNSGREIGRSIEKLPHEGKNCTGWGVKCTRIQRKGENRFGVCSTWVDYKFELANNSMSKIREMAKYVIEQVGHPKTQEQQRMINNMKMFLK
jgi:hypothetical protein